MNVFRDVEPLNHTSKETVMALSEKNKKRMFPELTKALAVLLLVGVNGSALSIGGAVSNVILTKSQNPIFVEKTIVVPRGDSLVIGEGCRLIFRMFTGIQVHGKLIINGTAVNTVCLTSQYDSLSPEKSDVQPNPGDWNGIEGSESTEFIRATYCEIRYPVVGILLPKEVLGLASCKFSMSEKNNVIIDGRTIPVPSDEWCSREVYGVTYHANGATTGTVPVDGNRYAEGAVVPVLSGIGISKAEHTFDGWCADPSGSGNKYLPGTSFIMPKNEVLFFASLQKDTIKNIPKPSPSPDASSSTKKVYLSGAGAGVMAIASIVSAVMSSRYSERHSTEFDLDKRKSFENRWRAMLITSISTGTLALGTGGYCTYSWFKADKKHALASSVDFGIDGVRTSLAVAMEF